MSAAQLETLISEAVAAVATGDYDTAQQKCVAAQIIIKHLPNMTGGLSSLQWQQRFDDINREIRQLKHASNGVLTRVPIRHARPESLEDCT